MITPILDYPQETRPLTKNHYIIIHESRIDNIIDILSGLIIIGFGWLIGIEIIQWFGLAIGVIMVITRIFQPENVYRADGIEDAHRILDMLDEGAQEEGL